MGKEWYWSGSRSSTSKRGGGDKESANTTTTCPSGCMSAVFNLFDFHHFQFPLHHQSSFKSTSFLPDEEEHTVLKGVEAPRNSLDLEKTPLSSNLNEEKEEENLKIPMGIRIKTSHHHNNNSGDTRSKSLASNYDSSSEISSSPGAKTPNLVARLMGLDLLPETNSPSSSSSSFHEPPNLPTKLNLHHHLRPRQVPLQNKPIIGHRNSMEFDVTGTRSLPETPRMSSARRSDVDHHRLSLQINKENIGGACEDLEFSRFSYLRRKEIKQEDEYRSPSHYARQIVKQVKESVNRKVGLDITNTLRNKETLQAREEVFNQLKTKKSSSRALNKIVADQISPGKHSSTPSCSPRLSRFLEPKQKPVTTTPTTTTTTADYNSSSKDHKIQLQPIRVLSSKPKLQPVQEQQQSSKSSDHRPAKKCKKAASERFSPRLKKPPKTADVIRNKQEESFVRPSTANRANNPDKNSKKTPLSNDLLNITVSNLLPVKKDPSPPATKIPQKQSSKRSSSSQLSSNSSQISYKQQEATGTLVARDNIDDRSNGVATTTTTTVGGTEHEYITRILKRTGSDKHTPVSFTTWFSPSHPIDPSIFHHLEDNIYHTSDSRCTGHLSLLCNRKLLFQLVDEILIDVLKPVINIKPWCNVNGSSCRGNYYGSMHGSDLIDTLCLMIGSFPCADCQVLEDIDGLIDRDLPKMKFLNDMAFEEEGEGVVMEIEKDILDSLVHETTFDFAVIRAS